MDRKDFNVVANSRGYQIQYKGQNIGGAGIAGDAKAPTGKAAWKQTQDYLHYGNMDIQAILAGHGRKDMLEVIARIDGASKMADWAVRFYLDYVVEAESRDEAVEKAQKEFTEELQNTKVGLTDLFQVSALKNIDKGG